MERSRVDISGRDPPSNFRSLLRHEMCKGQQLVWGPSPGDYKTVALKQNTDKLNDFDAFPGRAAKGSIIWRQSHLAYSHTLLESSFLTVSLDPPNTTEGSLKETALK
ncbi:uncharacterized protein [Hemitrygon akajei]|uniref:uncharacterized protein isoform X3 n=1 Tax=Hemitrygon akajei TaxID=2704970 RepID=UPI003BF95205